MSSTSGVSQKRPGVSSGASGTDAVIGPFMKVLALVVRYRAALILFGLIVGSALQYLTPYGTAGHIVLIVTMTAGAIPIVWQTVRGMLSGHFASDIVASLAIIGAAVTQEYIAGA